MAIKSKIYISETVTNTDPHPAANDSYIMLYVYHPDGTVKPAMATYNDVARMLSRAERNSEDVVPRYVTFKHKVSCKIDSLLTSIGKMLSFGKTE